MPHDNFINQYQLIITNDEITNEIKGLVEVCLHTDFYKESYGIYSLTMPSIDRVPVQLCSLAILYFIYFNFTDKKSMCPELHCIIAQSLILDDWRKQMTQSLLSMLEMHHGQS